MSYEAADDDDKEVMGREEETVEEDGEMEKEGEKGKDDESKRTECVWVFLNITSLEMEIDVEAESMHVPRPSQQTASMDSSRIEVLYYNDMHACMHLCIATI